MVHLVLTFKPIDDKFLFWFDWLYTVVLPDVKNFSFCCSRHVSLDTVYIQTRKDDMWSWKVAK